ncbi:MAG: OB-fold-containig protein [Nitrospinota bacterium]
MLLDSNLLFTTSLAIMFSITIVELVSVFMGFQFSDLLESILPDMDFDTDLSTLEKVSALTYVFRWFQLGKIPALILLVIFLTIFGILGLCLQALSIFLTGESFSSFFASLFAGLLTIPLVKITSTLFIRFFPKEETSAVSENSFIGMIATVVLGTAKKNEPAQAKLIDKYGKTHYLMIEPSSEREEYPAGKKVLLTDRKESVFVADRWDE